MYDSEDYNKQTWRGERSRKSFKKQKKEYAYADCQCGYCRRGRIRCKNKKHEESEHDLREYNDE